MKFRWSKPKSVEAITASLQTMMIELSDLQIEKGLEIADIVEAMNNLQQQRLNAEAERQLAAVVRTNLSSIFNTT